MTAAEAFSALWRMVAPSVRRVSALTWFALLPFRCIGVALIVLGGVVAAIGYIVASAGVLVANGIGEKGRRIVREMWLE